MRFEYKYIVPMYCLEKLRNDLEMFVTSDNFASHNLKHQYTVRSIYFDTLNFSAYREKIEGIKERNKIRIRGYDNLNDNSIVFLEIKSKNDQRGTKLRSSIYYKNLSHFFNTKDIENYIITGLKPEISHENAKKFIYHLIRFSILPVILITYDREAYQGKFDSTLRITLDKNLRFKSFPAINELYEENSLKYLAPKYFIMEIKFNNGYATWLQNIVTKYNLNRISISKYGKCIEASGKLNANTPRKSLDNRREEIISEKEVFVP